jgi:DNA mismatch endonuclease (patch repair protein)
MSRIRGRDTRPEMLIRRGLHGRGYRYSLHVRNLPGRPDLAFFRHRAVIFVHGCFWHGHDCPMFRLPATRADFWRAKIDTNRARDEAAGAALTESGWRSLIVWECALRGPARLELTTVLDGCVRFLVSDHLTGEVAGAWIADEGKRP